MYIDKKKLMLLMAKKNLNFKQLSSLSNVSRQTLSYANSGKSIRPAIMGKIAAGLEVDVTEIILED